MAGSQLVLITKAPYGQEEAFAGLRQGLALLVSGIQADMLMLEDGALNVVKTQKPDAIGMPSNLDAAMDVIGMEGKAYVVREDLEERKIPLDLVEEDIRIVSRSEVPKILEEYETTVTY